MPIPGSPSLSRRGARRARSALLSPVPLEDDALRLVIVEVDQMSPARRGLREIPWKRRPPVMVIENAQTSIEQDIRNDLSGPCRADPSFD